MAYILHIDTATDTGTVALAADGVILAARSNNEMRNHASSINIMISDVLTEVGIKLPNVDAVAICAGPGSYTGLRIGMATAKGLCYALDKPLITTDRLTLLTYRSWLNYNAQFTKYIALIIARDKEYFIATYDAQFKLVTSPQHILEPQLSGHIFGKEKIYIISDATFAPETIGVTPLTIDVHTSIDNSAWATFAYQQFKRNDFANLASVEPLYLKQVYTHK